ncbi:Splicing factor 3 subunit [Phytophthora palmivora]|uniref:Splicing factor 3 subunit n=1 Tax=Phytophthora palmivora TaxID=4796 RepID=A0A2P4YHW9_9STRA|nr:Splicing factor 3 subunit [Phytophthora palmivora]
MVPRMGADDIGVPGIGAHGIDAPGMGAPGNRCPGMALLEPRPVLKQHPTQAACVASDYAVERLRHERLPPPNKRWGFSGNGDSVDREIASRHPGMVRLVVKVPNDPDNAQWKLEGQTLTVELDVKDNMRTLKQKLMVSL